MPPIVLIAYIIITAAYILTVFFIIYHLIKYAVNSSLNLILLPLFAFVAFALLVFNFTAFSSIDWVSFWDKLIGFIK